ncbi:MAG: tetratricopeptide repeat protein, partial [Abditibacteriaceae bacterium]
TEAGDAKTAVAAFGAVLTKYPKSDIVLDARLQMANALLSDKQYAQAETNYRALIDDPLATAQKNGALVGLADAYFYEKDFANAATAYQLALVALPADAKNRAMAQLQLGNSFFNSNEYEEALKSYAPLLQNGDADIAAPALYYSASSQLSLKKFSEAATLYTKIIDTYPQHPLASKAALRLGDALADANENARAITAYQAVVTKYPQSDAATEARKSLAYLSGQASATQLAAVQTAYDAKDWTKTVQLAQALVDKKLSPQVTKNALYLWADASRQAGESTTAAQLFRRQIAAYPQGTLVNDARLGLTWSLLDAKQWKDAEVAARNALAVMPSDAKSAELRDRLQLSLGESLLSGGNAKDAAIAFSRVEKSADKDLATQAFYGEALSFEATKQWPDAAVKWAGRAEVSTDPATKSDSYLRQGLALQNAKNGEDALAAFDRAVAAYPTGDGAAQALYDSAWQAHDLKRPDDEAARWKRLSTDYPNSKFASDAMFQQAETLYNAKSYAAAVVIFRNVLAKAPQSDVAPLAWYNLGSALYYQKDWGEAALAFDQAVAAKQGFSLEASFWAGESWREAGKFSDAKTRYQTFLQGLGNAPAANLKVLAPQAQLGLGLTLAASNDWAGAANAYTAGLQNADGDTAAQLYYRLGEALAQQNKWQEASTQFLKVSISFPDSQWAEKAQWDAGQALEKSGNSAAALTIYKQLAARQPVDDVVKQAQARVQAMEVVGKQ